MNAAWPTALAVLLLWENFFMGLALEGSLTFGWLGSPATLAGGMPSAAPRLSTNTTIYSPLDTWILLALWASLAVRLLRVGDDGEPALPAA